jgi:hypothetical protein
LRNPWLQHTRHRDREPFDHSIGLRIGRLLRSIESDLWRLPRCLHTVSNGGHGDVVHGVTPVPPLRTLALAGAALALFACAPPVQAQESAAGDELRVSYAPKAIHLTSDPDYVDWNHIVAFEWVMPRHGFWGADRTHLGFSLFDNSYGQFSQSVYAGLEWDWREALGGRLFLSLSLGLVNGYEEPWEDKLPLNSALGIGVTLVPAIGWQRGPLGVAASWVGSAFTLRVSFSLGL